MLVTATILILLCLLFYKLKMEKQNYWKKKGISFEKPLLLLGNITDVILLRKSIGNKISELYFKFNDRYFGIWFFNKPQLVIKCPELIKLILVKDFDYFSDRHMTCEKDIDDFAGNMIFFMKNPKWKVIRTKTTPMFSSSKLKSAYPEMQVIAESMIVYINSMNRKVIDIKDVCVKYSTEAICASAYGINSQSFQDEDTPLIVNAKTLFDITLLNAIPKISHLGKGSLAKLLKITLIKASIAKNLKSFLLDVMEKRKTKNGDRRNCVDFLIELENKSDLRDDEVIAQASQFLVAGHETISSTISLALYELALNKSVQETLRLEIYSNLEVDGSIKYASLNTMDYLDKIVHETLRKYPVVPFLGRTCTRDYQIPNSAVVIEKGIDVIISVNGLHNDPKYFPNPDLFDPERFSLENIRGRHPYSYLPFGEGQRSCIGQRMGVLIAKLAIAHIIKNFEIEMCNKTNVPLQFRTNAFTLSVNGGIYIYFNKID